MQSSSVLPTNLLAFFGHFMVRQRWQFIVLLVAPVFIILESVLLPYILKLIVDRATQLDEGADIVLELGPYIALTAMTWTVMVSVFRAQEWVGNTTIPKFQAQMRMAVFDYTQRHSHRYFSDQFAGSIANKIGDLPRAALALLFLTQWNIILTVSTVLAAIIALGMVSWIFSAILIGWTTVHLGFSYYFSLRIKQLSHENAEDKSALSGKIVDVLSNILHVRLYARHDDDCRYIQTWQEKERISNFRTYDAIWKARMKLEPPQLVMVVLTLYFLSVGLQEGWVSAGDFVFVFFTSFNVLVYVWHLAAELPNIFREVGICKQALEIIAIPHEVADEPHATPLKIDRGTIQFDAVHFAYPDGRALFEDISLEIPAGQRIGLVGFSGSGKSSFVHLIMRLFDVQGGRILIDGQNISSVTQDSLHRAIAFIPQDTTLFHRSLIDNIRYGRMEATEGDVMEAAKQAHAHSFISELKEGYDTLVGERGIKLSGGQRQRIAIARAILKDAPILVLDEATASLDSVTEQHIQGSLQTLMQDRTTIVIAHRLSTLSGMDRILVFDQGRIIEDGTHDALLKQNGHYASLWQMQTKGELPEL